MWKKTFRILGVALVAFVIFLFWYRERYSMDPAVPVEMGMGANGGDVLIATQASEYKDLVLAALLEHLKNADAHVKVIDVSGLSAVDPSAWDAIVVIHTWENWKPQPDAAAFAEAHRSLPGLIVLTTSGGGDQKLVPDAISSASVVADAARDADRLWEELRTALGL
jgi:hypothetical protein